MAATDKPFNNQRTLDIVFAVSNILMLLSVVWMMVQDYSREYKTEQRAFREVESNLAVRLALQNLPDPDEFDKAEKAVENTRPSEAQITEVKEARKALAKLQPDKEKAEARFQAVQAELSSKVSFRDIALEHADTPEKTNDVRAQYDKILGDLNSQFDKAQADRDDVVTKMKLEQQKLEKIEAPHTKAVAEFKKVNDKIDAQIKLAITKRWGFGDWLRSQWMIEAFASPTKIHQFTINDIPIDYNFKQVTRFDRCMSCHVGIADARFSKENLEGLTKDDPNADKLAKARDFYDRRVKAIGNSPEVAMIPNPYRIESTKLSESLLTKSRISEFAAHPRLDLFVGANSKHPAEKVGCTACHSGQGSGTSFNDASHSPNSMSARKDWTSKNGWEFNHMWDFPMHSKRFVEASCLKCHHEVTDLVSRDGRVEAPKLMRGFNLVKENGCFGCHEISGWKSGQRIGPDLRVEPSPPLEYPMSPAEITRAQEDTDNRPGTMRKVGPSLARVKEKVSTAWIEKWLASPSSFRPDTKMPHYYGLSTNNVDALPDDQKRFPDTEMASIAHFLTKTSENYLNDAAKVRKDSAEAVRAEEDELTALINKGRLDEKEQTRLNELKWKRQLRTVAPLVDLAKDIKEDKDTLTRGRNLFIERGCLACHTHHGTESAGKNSPAISSDAMFGPNLTQIAEKFDNKVDGRKWLVQWIINPQLHSPRSRMPVTHLEPKEAADIAAWLLSQSSGREADDPWHKIAVKQPTKEELQNLVRVYLVRMLSKRDIESYLKGEFKDGADWDVVKADLTKDEVALRDKVNNEDDLKFYLGKKAVTRLGCFGCHDIPGFENTKSIGVGLNDWGKKPADRLAFEDIDNFFKKHYHTVDSLVDDNGKPVAAKDKDGKEPYESFYTEALTGHHRQRDGYLNQKIRDPRSYDYNRLRTWDDRARMPKFTFARPRKKDGENEGDFKARVMKDEAEAREAVATFVLGLTAEQVPTKSINQPTGDRMAEVKGRQILDKYNCASCHLIRPGVYDFKTSPKTIQGLDSKFESIADLIKNEIIHPNHHDWVGRNPLGADPLTAYGVPKIDEGELVLTLAEALRFTGKSKAIRNVQSGFDVRIPIEDVVGSTGVKSQEDFDRRFQASAPYGGTFADLMVPWLTSKQQPSEYRTKYKEEKEARHALPPTLFAQGERTQTEWLYKFLRDPERVRQLTILRMPKFNMSKDEAEGLVKYFAAVSRLNNPGIGLTYPHEVIPSRDELSSKYWRDKTAEYVKRLQSEKDKDGKSLYDTRLAAYQKIWEQVRADEEPALKSSLKQQNTQIEAKKKAKDAAEKKKVDEPDPAKKADLDKEIAVLAGDIEIAQQRKSEIEQALAGLDEKTQEKSWVTQEAYASDAYRLLTSRDLCTKCHQVGTIKAAEPASQGPPLDKAFQRLRPGWVERWVDQPQRFLPYPSLMPVYFERGQPKHQNLHAGPAREQIEALRDVLMNFDRVSNLSVNKTRDPSPPAGK